MSRNEVILVFFLPACCRIGSMSKGSQEMLALVGSLLKAHLRTSPKTPVDGSWDPLKSLSARLRYSSEARPKSAGSRSPLFNPHSPRSREVTRPFSSPQRTPCNLQQFVPALHDRKVVMDSSVGEKDRFSRSSADAWLWLGRRGTKACWCMR